MLDQRRRRWADVVQMLYKYFVFTGYTLDYLKFKLLSWSSLASLLLFRALRGWELRKKFNSVTFIAPKSSDMRAQGRKDIQPFKLHRSIYEINGIIWIQLNTNHEIKKMVQSITVRNFNLRYYPWLFHKIIHIEMEIAAAIHISIWINMGENSWVNPLSANHEYYPFWCVLEPHRFSHAKCLVLAQFSLYAHNIGRSFIHLFYVKLPCITDQTKIFTVDWLRTFIIILTTANINVL